MVFLSGLPLWVSMVLTLTGLLTVANITELKKTNAGTLGARAGIIAGCTGIILGIIQLGIYFDYWPINT